VPGLDLKKLQSKKKEIDFKKKEEKVVEVNVE